MHELADIVFPAATFVLGIAAAVLWTALQRALRRLARAEEELDGLNAVLGAQTGIGRHG